MKRSSLKIIFIILIIVLVIGAIYINAYNKKDITQAGEFIQSNNEDTIISNNILDIN